MEQIITEKPITTVPEKTKKQPVKRGMTQIAKEETKRERIQREQREEIECAKLEKLEKRVKLNDEVRITKSGKECINSTFGHNENHESVLEQNGNGFAINLSLSLLSSCASLQENNATCLNAISSPLRVLSQMSTSYSNLDDESLTEETSSALTHLSKKSSSDEECVSSHFLSQKILSDDDEDEFDGIAKSSSDNPIPNLTSLYSLDSCPLQGHSQLKSTNDIEISISQKTIAQLQVEEKFSSTQASTKKGISSASFLNREHTKKWSQDETLKFYKGLELFGTDFSMISRLFTNRTRKMCKNKFRKEEKVNIQEIEKRLQCNRSLRMKKVVQRLNAIRAKLNLKFAKTPEERIQIIQNARRSRFDSFNSIDSLDINVVETIESQLNGQSLF
ncbi:hypothetical protein ABPG72_021257 [Tetrahymena utriculariae]